MRDSVWLDQRNGRKFDVVAQGSFIEAGNPVEVVETSGNRDRLEGLLAATLRAFLRSILGPAIFSPGSLEPETVGHLLSG